MYRISLLPESYTSRIAEKKKKNSISRILGILVFASMAVLALAFGYKFMADQQVSSLEDESIRLSNEISTFQDAVNLANELDALNGVILSIEGGSPVLADVLVIIGNNTPPHVIMNSVNLQFADGSGTGSISGITDDHANVSQWMQILEETNALSDVKCTLASQTGESGSVSFSLNFTVLAAN